MEVLDAEDPRSIGEYRLLRRLGAGGMGRVYLARSAGGRTAAVKLVHPHFASDHQFRERFRREVDSARRVGGEWTAPVLDADPDARTPWVATGYVAGPSLADAIAEHGPLPSPAVRALGAGLAEALWHVHELGLVHRDVKPSNVLLTPTGPVLIDFGIARAADSTTGLTSSGVSVGSPGFMAPEQALGKRVGQPADLFAIGAVLAYATTGRMPFPGDNAAVLLYRVVHEEPELRGLEVLDHDLGELITRCLAKQPEVRPAPRELAAGFVGWAGNAAELTRADWLPGPILHQVSQVAVELLNLEREPDPAAERDTSEDAGAKSVAVPPREQPDVRSFTSPEVPSSNPSARPTGLPHPEVQADVPELLERPRRRRLAPLWTAVVVLVVLFGGLVMLAPSAGNSDDSGDAGGGSSPSATSDGPRDDSVPERFIGQWAGPVVEGKTDMRSMRVTITQGGKSSQVANGTLDYGGLECQVDWQLVRVQEGDADGKVVTLHAAPVPGEGANASSCKKTSGTFDFQLRPDDFRDNDELRVRESDSSEHFADLKYIGSPIT